MYWLPFVALFLDCWCLFGWPKLLILNKIHQFCKIIDIKEEPSILKEVVSAMARQTASEPGSSSS
jgi:hypothetical protein